MSPYDPFVPFSPPPGLLVEGALRRIHVNELSGEDEFRVTLFGGTEQTRGSRDECVAFIEDAWRRALWTPYDERVAAEHFAESLRCERRDGSDRAWRLDVALTNALRGLHMAS